jgi:hypothetical protein
MAKKHGFKRALSLVSIVMITVIVTTVMSCDVGVRAETITIKNETQQTLIISMKGGFTDESAFRSKVDLGSVAPGLEVKDTGISSYGRLLVEGEDSQGNKVLSKEYLSVDLQKYSRWTITITPDMLNTGT